MDQKMEITPIAKETIHLYLTNKVKAREQAQKIFRLFIVYCKNQTKAAKTLDILQQTFNRRFNHGKTIHLEDVLMMLQIMELKKTEADIWQDFIVSLSISERIKLAIDDQKRYGKRQGPKPKKNETENTLIRHTYDEFTGRTDDYLAKKYGFKSRFSLRDAMQVCEKGCHELIAAMDEEMLEIHSAARLSTLSKTLQRQLLLQDEPAILTYLRTHAV